VHRGSRVLFSVGYFGFLLQSSRRSYGAFCGKTSGRRDNKATFLNTNESAKHKSETGPFPSCLAGGHPAALRDFWSDILLGSGSPKIALSDAMSIGFYLILRM
jgi:hypothetical protein